LAGETREGGGVSVGGVTGKIEQDTAKGSIYIWKTSGRIDHVDIIWKKHSILPG